MNSTLRTILIILAVLFVGGALFWAGMMFGGPVSRAWMPGYVRGSEYYPGGPGMMGGGGYGPGMMGYRNDGYGPGMMGSGGYGPGMMGNWRDPYVPGPGMMGRNAWGGVQTRGALPLTIEEARDAAADYIQGLEIEGLEAAEVMIFDNHAYVVVEETASGMGAFELLVDSITKTAYPEHGPNMMWNLKYSGVNHRGMMGGSGMMGLWQGQDAAPAEVAAEMPVTAEAALEAAQTYLDKFLPGAKSSSTPVQFYGYYTFDFEQNGREAGMLSVNGYSGQVYLHTWHGTFIEEAE